MSDDRKIMSRDWRRIHPKVFCETCHFVRLSCKTKISNGQHFYSLDTRCKWQSFSHLQRHVYLRFLTTAAPTQPAEISTEFCKQQTHTDKVTVSHKPRHAWHQHYMPCFGLHYLATGLFHSGAAGHGMTVLCVLWETFPRKETDGRWNTRQRCCCLFHLILRKFKPWKIDKFLKNHCTVQWHSMKQRLLLKKTFELIWESHSRLAGYWWKKNSDQKKSNYQTQ